MKKYIDDEIVAPEYVTAIEIPYDVRFMGLAFDWISAISELIGCEPKNAYALHLALEETLTFLINAYPDAEANESIRILFRFSRNETAYMTISNAGPPVHLDRIPCYDPEAAAESDADGLWYFMAKNAVDEFAFQNCGKEGWRVSMQKKLVGASLPQMTAMSDSQGAPADKVTYLTRRAMPCDAAALVDLTYDAYRYSYPLEKFYDESALKQALESGMISSIVLEANGVIIGSVSFELSALFPRCACSGSLMISREFRQSRAVFYLSNAAADFIAKATLDVDLYYSTLCTTHTGSQKVAANAGQMPVAILLSMVAAMDYRGMELEKEERENFLLSVVFSVPPEFTLLYLPLRHHSVMLALLTQAGFAGTFSAEEQTPAEEQCEFSVTTSSSQGNAYLTIIRLGADWSSLLSKRVFGLKAKGFKTVFVLVPAWRPLPAGLESEMGHINAIFCGVKPVSSNNCYLVYCSLSGHVNFDGIQLADPLAKNLLMHCRRIYHDMLVEEAQSD